MNPRIWKWINRIFLSGIWVQPFAMAGLIWFFKNVLQGDVSYLILFVLSFLPSIYIWSENQREQAAGKMDFSIEDTFHDRPTEYSSPLKMQAMYPRVNERFLFDYPEGVVFGRTETGMVKKHTEYLCKPLEKEHYRDGHVLLIGGSGSGKSASVIIPTLLASPDNMGMFIVDIKGELWRKSRRVDDKNTVIIDFQDRSKYGWDGLYMLNSKVEIRDKDVRECMEMIANIDKQCPHVVPQTKDEAWYLMPKAKPYKLNRKRNIYSKILEMLQLARIIQSIHERDKAHRDIKPENILVLNGKLVLSDFGLCWGIGEERLTGLNERVGPYKIMPPELERVQTDLDLDFKPSDVYLFSKVLWMTLKGDNIGFRGQYQRGEVQIYLNKEDYDNVITLEPIHKLMEEATFEEMGKRISIQKCIEYLELQRKILNREEYELLSNEFVSQLLYDEYSKKIIACSKPDELTYKDAAIITHMLRDIIPISNIFVKSLHSDQNIKQIQITDFQVGMDGICKLLYYNKGIKIKEYLLNISKMNYSNYSSVISLELNDISLVDEGYIAYSAAGHGFGNEYPRVYFSSGEKIIIKRKENL